MLYGQENQQRGPYRISLVSKATVLTGRIHEENVINRESVEETDKYRQACTKSARQRR